MFGGGTTIRRDLYCANHNCGEAIRPGEMLFVCRNSTARPRSAARLSHLSRISASVVWP